MNIPYTLTLTSGGDRYTGDFADDQDAELWTGDLLVDLGHDADALTPGEWQDENADDDGRRLSRLLWWATPDDAEHDDGARAVASLEVIR